MEDNLTQTEKFVKDKYGDVGLKVYQLIDGQRTAEEILKETGLTDVKLLEILNWLGDQGIIKLNYPEKKLEPKESIKKKENQAAGTVVNIIESTNLAKFEESSTLQFSTQAQKEDYEKAKAYNDLGNECYENGEYEKAVENYNLAISLDPKTFKAYFNRALNYYQLKEFDKSLADYNKSAELDPSNPAIYNNRGDVYYHKQDFQSAIKDYDKAISLDPNYMKAFYNRGLSYCSLENYEMGIKDFTKVIELKQDFAEAYHLRGLAYEYSGNFSSAIVDYKKALELKPELIEAKIHLEAAEQKQKTQGTEKKQERRQKFAFSTPSIDFSSVAGMDALKKWAMTNVIAPLKNADVAKKYKKKFGGGVLLYGPPGCGKTYFVNALAGEAKLNMINVKISEILNLYVGETEKAFTELFNFAKQNVPCIIFIDEIDGLGAKRSSEPETGGRWLNIMVNQLLSEMSESNQNAAQILVIGATNMPWRVDDALKRSGRFGTVLYTSTPDSIMRKELFQIALKDLPLDNSVNIDELVRITEDFAASDIIALCEKASTEAFEKTLSKKVDEKITQEMLIKAIKEERSDIKEWFTTISKVMNDEELREFYPDLLEELNRLRIKSKSVSKDKTMYG